MQNSRSLNYYYLIFDLKGVSTTIRMLSGVGIRHWLSEQNSGLNCL